MVEDLKEVELYEGAVYLNEYEEYQPESLLKLFEGCLSKATKAGLTECFLKFNSTLEPYEDCSLGPVKVTPCGYRPHNERELHDLKEQKEISAFADKLGVSFYEASIAKRLMDSGKLKGLNE